MKTAIAVVAALCAAFCFALGSLIQQGAARQTHGRALRLSLLATLAREKRWLGGVALTVVSFGIQATALAFGPLTLVQPLAATDVLFALPMIAHRNRRPLTRRGIFGGLSVAAGIAVFIAVSPPAGGVGTPSLTAWAPALAGIAALTGLSGFLALRARGQARVIWLAAAAAVIYGLLDAITKSTVDMLPTRGAGVLATWEPYALIVAGVLGGLFGQSAFNAGPLSLSLPVIDTVEPVSAVILGVVVFRESLARSPWQFALQLAGGAIAVAGIAILSHSSVVLTEERLGSRTGSMPGDGVPEAPENG
jgi:drug/metabolite transporter (DMT)-like permease